MIQRNGRPMTDGSARSLGRTGWLLLVSVILVGGVLLLRDRAPGHPRGGVPFEEVAATAASLEDEQSPILESVERPLPVAAGDSPARTTLLDPGASTESPRAPVMGTLTRDGKTPSSRTRVVLLSMDTAGSGPPVQAAKTSPDGQGRFSFSQTPPGKLQVVAQELATDPSSTAWEAQSEVFEAPHRDLHLILRGGTEQLFRAVDDLGQPIPDFVVYLKQDPRPGVKGQWRFPARDGQVVANLQSGRFQLTVQADGHATHGGEFDLNDTGAPIQVVLVRAVTVRGTVLTSTGTPAPGTAVHVKHLSGLVTDRSGPEGRFELFDLPPGALEVSATPGRVALGEGFPTDESPFPRELHHAGPGEVLELSLTLPVGARIEGLVQGADPLPLLVRVEGEGLWTQTPVESKRFSIDGLPAGRYQLTSLMPTGAAGQSFPIDLAEGELRRVVLGGALIDPMILTGRVLLPGGEPRAARLLLVNPDGPSGLQIVTEGSAGMDGAFTLPAVERGAYRLVAEGGPEWVAEVAVKPSSSTLELRLVPCGTFRIRHPRAFATSCSGASWPGLSFLRLSTKVPKENYSWPAGTWPFRFTLDSSEEGERPLWATTARTVEVRAGQETVVELDGQIRALGPPR